MIQPPSLLLLYLFQAQIGGRYKTGCELMAFFVTLVTPQETPGLFSIEQSSVIANEVKQSQLFSDNKSYQLMAYNF
jgi:hypothetical protein